MNVQDFRNNLKQHMDNAVRGIPVIIERGGMQFTLIASPKGVAITHADTIVEEASDGRIATLGKQKDGSFGLQITKPVRKPRAKQTADPEKNYCEHGQIKGECLVKGCRYGHKN